MKSLVIRSEADLAIASRDHLLALMFCQSASSSYAAAVAIARTLPEHVEQVIDERPFHFVLFDKTRDQAIKARSLIAYVGKWRGTQIFAGGLAVQNSYHMKVVLDCYIASTACADPRAHCHVVSDRHEVVTNGKKAALIYPCRYLAPWAYRDIDPRHPSSLRDQFQASAVRRGCDWCPHFNADDIDKIQNDPRLP